MSVPVLLLAAAAALAGPNDAATALTCDLALPEGSRFHVEGYFDAGGLHSNLSTLIQNEGVFAPAAPDFIVIMDGTDHHRWQLDSVANSQKFDAFLTQYPANRHGIAAPTAVLLLESRRFIGRHWGRSLVGVGLCDVRRGQADE